MLKSCSNTLALKKKKKGILCRTNEFANFTRVLMFVF